MCSLHMMSFAIIINFISNDWEVKYVTINATMDPKL
jgi:hypothetical protein